MLKPEQLIRIVIELIFVLLGALVVWLGVTKQTFFDPRQPTWLILSVALILWGAYAFLRPGRAWLRGERWTRGISLILLGIVMFAISRVPFLWVSKLFAVAGVILILRGIIGTALILRPR